MQKTKDQLLRELKEVAVEVFNNIKPDEITKADIQKLIDAATTARDDATPEADDDPNAANPEADAADDTPEQPVIGSRLFKKWGVNEDGRKIVLLALAGYELSPDDVFAVKVYSPTKVVIVTRAGKKCEFIDCR